MAIREPIVQTRAAPIRRGVQLFRPPDVFTGGEAGLALTVEEAVLQGRIWQDSAGTTRANKIDDPVGRLDDISGDGNNLTQSTATARPLLKQTAGGRWHLEFDETDDEYTVTLPDITDGTVVLIGVDGIWIDDAFNHSAGTWTLGYNSGDNNYTGGPAGILTTVGGLLGVTVLDRQLTAAERQAVIDYGISAGAPGHFELGDELVTNGTFDTDVSGWTTVGGIVTWDAGRMHIDRNGQGPRNVVHQAVATEVAGYLATVDVVDYGAALAYKLFVTDTNPGGAILLDQDYLASQGLQTARATFDAISATSLMHLVPTGTVDNTAIVDNISLRKLTLVTP